MAASKQGTSGGDTTGLPAGTTARSVGPNQDGGTPVGNETFNGARTPGEVLIVGQNAAHSAASGPNIDTAFVDNYVLPAFDLAVKEPLRDRLIWDQFVTKRTSMGNGQGVTVFLGDDIDETGATTPLVENLDVDSVTFGAWSMSFSGDEYGRAVSRTRLANALTAVNIDPQIVDRVAWDAARAVDALASKGFDDAFKVGVNYQRNRKGTAYNAKPATIIAGGASGTAGAAGAPAFLTTTTLQVAATGLELRNVLPFRNGNYILLCNPVGAQHLKNERDTGGFRYVTARNEGAAGNSIYRGTIGMTEGVEIVVSNRVPAGKAYLIGQDALCKTNLNSEGYGDMPQMIVAPVIDKLRRFLSWGWLHFVGYAPYDVRSMIEISHSTTFRPAGTAGNNAAADFITDITIGSDTANKDLERYLTMNRKFGK